MGAKRGTPEERFWRYIEKDPNSGCWLWMGATNPHGYGRMMMGSGRSAILAHRLSWEMHKGPVGDAFVLHRCDTPPCCNPDHLFLGTQTENVADAKAKRRFPRGSKHHNSKLTEEQVVDIRARSAAGATQAYLAGLYGISRSAVGLILGGQRRAA